MLGKRLSKQQWLALGLLSGGVGLVQTADAPAAAAAVAGNPAALAGIVAVLASSLLSGFANVYFEKVRRLVMAWHAAPRGHVRDVSSRGRRGASPLLPKRKRTLNWTISKRNRALRRTLGRTFGLTPSPDRPCAGRETVEREPLGA